MGDSSFPSPDECLDDSDRLDILEDDIESGARVATPKSTWRILVVDDDHEVHSATRFALSESAIVGRKLELLSAYSAAEGRDVLEQNPDVAVVLLDVVMEEHDAGLKFVEWMRERGYEKQRVILRTGQPGYAPELDVIRNYDINDYRTKGELTQTRLVTAMTSAIRTFEQFWVVERQRLDMENFAYALAHDFKQTTRQIRVFSDMVAKTHDEDDDTGVPQALSYLGGAARRLGALVDTMAQYTLIGRTPEIEQMNIEQVFSDVRSALDPVLKETGGELTLSGGGECAANAALVVHALQILIANGLQHNESLVPRVEVSITDTPAGCEITVSDNGIGIEAEYIEQIFRPHMRLRQSGEASGMGLGLTLSRRAIETQGGSIWCESSPGAGSVFRVRFPKHGDVAHDARTGRAA